MERSILSLNLFGILAMLLLLLIASQSQVINAEDPTFTFDWNIEYGEVAPLGLKQRGILINGQFPGPTLDLTTNNNVIINVYNKLNEPFLITWHGIKQRKVSWEDGVLGTNCPIPPNSNWTYRMQMKDQIGTYSYYPSTLLHRAAGGYGGLNILQRSVISKPYDEPVEQFTLIVSDWWNTDNKVLQQTLDAGNPLPFPDGLLINGQPKSTYFTGNEDKLYQFRVSNLCMTTSINFRIQGHVLTLIEVEGSHTMQDTYESLDIHVGQSASFLVLLTSNPKDYYIVASTRFTKPVLTATAILHYNGSNIPPSLPLPIGQTYQIHWSMKQARTIKWNLTANAARPNPQGSYHYGIIPTVRTIVLANSKDIINGKTRHSINKVSYINPDTPLKLADYFSIAGVFVLNGTQDTPPPASQPATLGTTVYGLTLHDYVEIVFQNNENYIQSYHLDGYDFWAVGYGHGIWNTTLRERFYNLEDATTRNTIQVYPGSWSAIYVSLDNKGMWNLRSAIWPRRYLGQELYLRVWNSERSLYTESDIPDNAILCGKALKP